MEFSKNYPSLCPTQHIGAVGYTTSTLSSSGVAKGHGRQTIVGKVSIPKLWGVRKGAFTSNTDFWGTNGTSSGPTSSPTNKAYAHVFVVNPTYEAAIDVSLILRYKIMIETIVLFNNSVIAMHPS